MLQSWNRQSIPRPGSRLRQRLLKFGLLALVAAAGLYLLGRGGGWLYNRWLSGTSYAALERIEVVGNNRLTALEIRRAALPKQDSPGSLSDIELDSVTARVERLPGVLTAHAFRRLPGRLVIQVEERLPVAAALVGNELNLMDEDGRTFKRGNPGEVLDLPLITGNFIKNGRMLRAPLDLILKLRDDFPNIYEHLGEVRVGTKTTSIRLREGGAEVRAADIGDLQTLGNLELFLEQKGGELPADLRYVDMRFATMIVTGASESMNIRGE